MADNMTTTIYLGADGLYQPGAPRMRMSAPAADGHVAVDVGGLSICAFGSDGIAQLRELAAALEDAADRYALARVQAVPA